MGSRPRKVTASWQRAYFIARHTAKGALEAAQLDRVNYTQIAAAMGAGAGFAVGRALHHLPAGIVIGAAAGLVVGLLLTRLKETPNPPPPSNPAK